MSMPDAEVYPDAESIASWHCVNGKDLAVQLSRTVGDVTCCIFHMPTTEVEIGDAVALWGRFDAAKPPCGHTFNACALALHYITNAMTCPVCRAGFTDRMCVQSVPVEIQDLFKTVIHKDEDDTHDTFLHYDPADIAAELRLFVSSNELHGSSTVFLSTPLHETDETGTEMNFHMYRTHRSFQRHFNTLVRQSEDTDTPIYLSIYHPLLEQPLSSEVFTLDAFTSDFEIEIFENSVYAHIYNFGGLTRVLIQIDATRLFNTIVQAVVFRLS
jgi:hypothetical protein